MLPLFIVRRAECHSCSLQGGLSIVPELNVQRQFQRPGYTESVCRLLRTLRNIMSHYGEQ